MAKEGFNVGQKAPDHRPMRLNPTKLSIGASRSSQAWLGVSVHRLANGFLRDVHESGLDRTAAIYNLDLQNGKDGVIRRKGKHIMSPIDGKKGASYVNCLD